MQNENQKTIDTLTELKAILNNDLTYGAALKYMNNQIDTFVDKLSKPLEPEYRRVPGPASVGLYVKTNCGQFAEITHVSADGLRIYWGSNSTGVEPVLYELVEPARPMEFEGTLAEFALSRIKIPGKCVPATQLKSTQIVGEKS